MASPKLSMQTLLERQAQGKPVASAYYYDRKDMTVSHPAERVKLDPKKVDMASAEEVLIASEAAGIVDLLSANARKARRDLYRKRVANKPSIKRIVSEGDSWHLYPIILDEIVDQLNKDTSLAIFSTDGAGDTIAQMWQHRNDSNQGFQKSIAIERPSVFLLNGGGNDLLQTRTGPDGKKIGNLYFHLKDFQAGMTAAQLIKPTIDAAYDAVENTTRSMIAKALEFPWIKKVVFHGYDYPFPDNDLWLGKPMHRRGIANAALQRQIVIELINRLHHRLVKVAQSFAASGKVHYVDVRGTVTGKAEWYDEIHPRSSGFKRIAAKIKAKL
jgi:lysophospholipase L1-like esterase